MVLEARWLTTAKEEACGDGVAVLLPPKRKGGMVGRPAGDCFTEDDADGGRGSALLRFCVAPTRKSCALVRKVLGAEHRPPGCALVRRALGAEHRPAGCALVRRVLGAEHRPAGCALVRRVL